MKILLPILLLLLTGCSTPYMVDWGRDAADIFTLTYEWGAGTKARMGPFAWGCGVTYCSTGLRGGVLVSDKEGMPVLPSDCPSTSGSYDGSLFGIYNYESFQPFSSKVTFNRHKRIKAGVEYNSVANELENIGIPFYQSDYYSWRYDLFPDYTFPPYYTQIEVFVAFILGLRVGFNPGELLDFIVGWTTLDLCHDDVAEKEALEEAEKAAKKAKMQKQALQNLQAKTISFDSKSFFDALRKDKKEEIKLFLQAGMNPNSIDDLGLSAIVYPIRRNDLDTVKSFFKHGADIEFMDKAGRTPLILALCFGVCFHPEDTRIDIVDYLLSKGADVNIKTKTDKQIPILMSVFYGQYKTTERLLLFGADPNVSDGPTRKTPLHWAVRGIPPHEGKFDYLPIIKLLIKHGADIDHIDDEGFTLLHWACHDGQKKNAKFLIENGVDPNVKNKQGEKPIDIAREKGFVDIVKLLGKATRK